MSISLLAPLARLLTVRAESADGQASRQTARRGRSLAAHLIIPLVIGAGSLVLALALGAELLVQERAQQDLVARRADRATELTRRFVLDTERTLMSSASQLAGLPGISESVPAEDASRLRSELLSAQNRDHLGLVLVLNSAGEVAIDLIGPGTLDLLKPLLPRVQRGGEQSALVWHDDTLWMLAAAPERAVGSQPGLAIVGRQIDERALPDRGAAGASVALAFAGRTLGPTELPDSVEGRNSIVTAGGDGLEAIASVSLEPYREAVRVGYIGVGATAVGCLLLFIVYNTIVIRRAARPLKSLAEAVSAVAAGDRTVAAPVEGPDEVATVGRAFNEMVVAIAAREEELRTLARENEGRYQQLKVLNELSHTILGSLDLETIASGALDACMTIGSFDLGNVYLYDASQDLLMPFGNRGFQHPEVLGPRQLDAFDRMTGDRPRLRYESIATRKPQVLEDLQSEDGFRTLKSEGVLSGIFVPLLAEEEIFGVLQLGSRTKRSFEQNQVSLLESAGHQFGMAIQKARLYEEARKAYADQRAVEESRERLVAILEATTDIVGIRRVDGSRMYLNQAGRRVLGVQDEKDLSELGLAEGRPLWAEERLLNEAIPAAIRDGSWSGETAFLGPDGAEIPFSQVIIAHKDSDGKVAFLSTIARDISAQKDAERRMEALAQTEKLRALGQMAGGIAHDLNQCLALVAGHTELAARSLERSPDSEPARASLRTVLRAARDGAQSVKRLQTYARPAQSEPPSKLDLAALVSEVAKLTAPAWRDAAQQHGRRIEVHVDADGDTTIEGSAPDLREAFTNLVLNAVDALTNGGTIDLLVRRRGDQVQAEVRDSGVGMPAEVRARIFEPFFTTKGEHGLGLGLSMVFGVVERHAGKVEVESQPGRGTTFRLSFAAALGEADNAETMEGLAPVRLLRILAVDDEPDIANMVSLMLQPFGHEMAVATSGEEALERLAREPFDLVISDVGMGARMNGWELAERVKRDFPGVRLVLATGWGAEIDQNDARLRGVDAVVSKPFRIADLQRVVAAI